MAKAAETRRRSRAGRAPSAPLDGPDTAGVLHRLLKLNNRLMAPFATHLEKQHRITVNGFRVLMMTGRLGVTASHELVEALGVNPMSVHRAVQALHEQGRIVIEPDPDDSRRKSLRLSAQGQRLYRKMAPISGMVADYLFSRLGPDEVQQFDSMVSRLISGLEARDDQGRSVFLERTRPGPEDSGAS